MKQGCAVHIVHPAVEKQASIAPRIPERKAVLKFITNPPIMTLLAIVMMMMMMVMMMACRHIPTMTISHHGGEMPEMKMVGTCQCQIPTIHDKLQQLALVSFSTRPQC